MKFRTLLAAAAGAMMLVSGTTAALAEKLVISNWDGYMPKDMAEKFKAATGIDLEIAVHATNEEIMGKVTASGLMMAVTAPVNMARHVNVWRASMLM